MVALLLVLLRRTYPKGYFSAAILAFSFVALAFALEGVAATGRYYEWPLQSGAALAWLVAVALIARSVFELVKHRPPVRRRVRWLLLGATIAALAVGPGLVSRPELAPFLSPALHLSAAAMLVVPALVTARNRKGDRRFSLTILTIAFLAGAMTHAAVGAVDLIIAGYDARPWLPGAYMLLAVTFVLSIFEDERESAALAAMQIELMAYHDATTGLPNRSLFFDRCVLAMAHAQRYHYQAAVLFFDVDRFKSVNDSLGHHTGDALLKTFATRIQQSLRVGDTPARFGGDEFTLLLPRLESVDDAVAVARKLLRAIREPVTVGSRELVTTTSVGIAIFPEDGADPEALIRNADAAMYRAKEQGGDRYELYSPAMSESALAKLEIENRLRRALENEELELHYLPMIGLATGDIFGVEALLRWRSPEFGYVPPQRFVEAAEVSGLILDIGEWVLREACRQVSRWQIEHKLELVIAVNLSARQFRQADLLLKIQRALSEAQMPPSSLHLEITESNLMDDAELTVETLRTLKTIGVKISIDDFGTGFSSLAYLQKFPIDSIKLDRSFVSHCDRHGEAAIIKGVIAIAHGLGIKVVAEGVESEEQLAFLNEQGCDVAQGFLFSEPVPVAQFPNYIRQHRELVAGEVPSRAVEHADSQERRRALVVDDDPAIRSLVERVLKRANFAVDGARDGEEAMELLERNTYSAVFLDIMMPRMDGYEVIAALKEKNASVLRRVVVMTAVAPAALERLSGEPIARIVPKPFDINQIIASANDAALVKRAG